MVGDVHGNNAGKQAGKTERQVATATEGVTAREERNGEEEPRVPETPRQAVNLFLSAQVQARLKAEEEEEQAETLTSRLGCLFANRFLRHEFPQLLLPSRHHPS